jgi:hypothetical protein
MRRRTGPKQRQHVGGIVGVRSKFGTLCRERKDTLSIRLQLMLVVKEANAANKVEREENSNPGKGDPVNSR